MTAGPPARVRINGAEQAPDAAVVSVFDRGFQYGDGVFETAALIDGCVREADAHIDRLCRGARLLGMPPPEREGLQADLTAMGEGVAAGERAVVKVVYTRGSGGRGLQPPATPRPTRVVMRLPWPGHPAAWREQGVRVISCRTRQMSGAALDGRIKSMNQLNHIVARMEWTDPEIAEGLLCDEDGGIVEGTVTNLFAVREGEVVTPDLARSGLPGVTRGRLLEVAASLGIPAQERPLAHDELGTADELFLTNSIVGVWPVRELDGRAVADGRPGPITRRLQAALEAIYAA